MANILPGTPLPLGVSKSDQGYNFSLVSKHAKKVEIIFFAITTNAPLTSFSFNPLQNKTGDIWHCELPLDEAAFAYIYRVDGQDVIDPYAKALLSSYPWGNREGVYNPICFYSQAETAFDWENDRSPCHPVQDLIIYEMHVRGFTCDRSSHVAHPGSYLGVIEKLPHLSTLGINAIELLPIFEFNECDNPFINPLTGEKLLNYWGYSPIHFFAPMHRYASKDIPGREVQELKMLVKEAHRLGIEVYLDVVYNHTGEGNENGPKYCFKNLDEATYYILDERGKHTNYTGCGNTINGNHPVTKQLIMDSLRHWVLEYHIDGFRFDLASTLTRDSKGVPMTVSSLIEDLSHDPLLSQVKLIAEPWDAGGLYQVGSFSPSCRWLEWNGKYRDIVRRFIAGYPFNKGGFATCICGSQDLYGNRSPLVSQNFITIHDGFTLHDLVSYNHKHNQGNGENNQDGNSMNDSWNCGHEGPSHHKKILHLRIRQMKNYMTALMISQGVPILLMGDEYGHTKKGNNNTWCQDNELNWFQWNMLEQNQSFFRFYKNMIKFRKNHEVLKKQAFLTAEDIQWHGLVPFAPLWDLENHLLAFTLLEANSQQLYVAFNCSKQTYQITLPPLANQKWKWIVNTYHETPNDFYDEAEAPFLSENFTEIHPHSAIILKSFKLV